ncbi:MAG: LysM peptidoglycan-binding domain-containing protein [Roseburia sp.]|nr:LysM peptidoglycan-binding domain-containing protein [Roseburia sp.]
MENQTNTSQIPINTRTVGAPSGIYILYLEDYVHTFIRKLLPQQTEITLWGRRYEENGRSILVVSGAMQKTFSEEEAELQKYFSDCAYLGTARPERNKDGGLRLELLLGNTSVALDDFYIYYDQNEEMQNYLVEWNAHNTVKNPNEERPEPYQGYRTRTEKDEAVRFGRIAQAYNREEAKVSFMWNVMNVLCLGFVMCVMVYGIISINNYHKMQDMQATIDYCMAFIEQTMQWSDKEDKSVPTSAQVSADDDFQNAGATSNGSADNPPGLSEAEQSVQNGAQNLEQNELQGQPDMGQGAQASEQDGVQGPSDPEQNAQPLEQDGLQSQSDIEQSDIGQSAWQSAQSTNTQSAAQEPAAVDTSAVQPGTASIPQYYVVQRGDTLRSISYAVYGSYSMVDEICEWNKIENPDNILCGQRLLLP